MLNKNYIGDNDMATIKEMAEEYAATGEFLENGKEMIDFQAEKAFIASAIAVLDELMKFIDNRQFGTEEGRVKFALLCLQSEIYDKVEELKGE